MTELQHALALLDRDLASLEASIQGGQVPLPAALEDFKTALDAARTTVHAVVNARGAADHGDRIRELRLQRGGQVCRNVSRGILEGTIDQNTPGVKLLRFAVEQTLARLRVLTKAEA